MDRGKDEDSSEDAFWSEEGVPVSAANRCWRFWGSLADVSFLPGSKILYYISCLRQLEKSKNALGNSAVLVDRMNGMPRIIIDGLIKRFTETAKGSTK